MLLIDCPHCGPRDEVEFHYGGQAHVAYPEDPYALSDAQWAEFLFYRDNPRGPFAERWQHGVGCRKWFNAIRDTSSYEFLAVYPMGTQPPQEYAHLVTPQAPPAGQAPSASATPAANSAATTDLDPFTSTGSDSA